MAYFCCILVLSWRRLSRHVASQLWEELSSIIHIHCLLWRLSRRLIGWKWAFSIYLVLDSVNRVTSWRSTCVRFFGWGATDLEMLFTSLWTCVKIWFRFSTFSFFTALICEDKRYSRAAATTSFTKTLKSVRVSASWWPALLCSCASGVCLRPERRFWFSSLSVYSSPFHLRRATEALRCQLWTI